MAHKLYCGIDNGTTGSIGFVGDGVVPKMIETPTIMEQSYTKKKQKISRINHAVLKQTLIDIMSEYGLFPYDVLVVMERPRINPGQFATSISAARSLEATLCVVEDLGLPRMYCDSKQWQRVLLPKGIEGSAELKKASKDIGCRLFPTQSELINKHKDGDGLLIAEWSRREGL